MDAVLIDTDVFSYLIRNDVRAESYRQQGTASLQKLETRIRAVVIVPFDLDVCREYAKISALKTDTGSDRTIAANDRWIAACAMRHKLPLISNNRKHFEGIPNLTLISEAPTAKPKGPTEQKLPLGATEPMGPKPDES